jgi:hypothetical protein
MGWTWRKRMRSERILIEETEGASNDGLGMSLHLSYRSTNIMISDKSYPIL